MKANQQEMDQFNYLEFLIKKFTIDDKPFTCRYRRTPNAFRIEILYDDKVVSSAYMMYLNKGKAELRRVYTIPKFRGIGLANEMLTTLFRDIGKGVEFFLTPSPNRIEGLTQETMEHYREKLMKFYAQYGFVRKSETNFCMIRKAG